MYFLVNPSEDSQMSSGFFNIHSSVKEPISRFTQKRFANVVMIFNIPLDIKEAISQLFSKRLPNVIMIFNINSSVKESISQSTRRRLAKCHHDL